MTRHSKNATAHSTYTYHEKIKDSIKSGYGSRKRRLGAESGDQFDCCCITLQTSDDLMISKQGILYDRKAVLEYILEQKRLIDIKLKEYENQRLKEIEDADKEIQSKKDLELKKFIETNSIGKAKENEKTDEERCYWSNSWVTNQKKDKLCKPDTIVRCPVTKDALKYKNLYPVSFTKITNAENSDKYKCPISGDTLTNAIALVALRPSKSIVTLSAYERLVKPFNVDPINNAALTESDVIFLKRGASSFSEVAGDKLVSQVKAPVMLC